MILPTYSRRNLSPIRNRLIYTVCRNSPYPCPLTISHVLDGPIFSLVLLNVVFNDESEPLYSQFTGDDQRSYIGNGSEQCIGIK